VPDGVLLEADRLESLFFDGYDPYFEGDDSRPLDRKGQSGAQQSQGRSTGLTWLVAPMSVVASKRFRVD